MASSGRLRSLRFAAADADCWAVQKRDRKEVTLNKKTSVLVLSVLAMALLLVASFSGIILDDGGSPYLFTSLRGEAVDIYGGKGLYQYDSVYKAVLFRGFDWANLIVGIPLLAWGMYLYQRRQLRGQLLIAAVFTYLAYNYGIGVMGNAFNVMFLVWTALFSVGLFGLALLLPGIDISSFPEKQGVNFPRRSLSVYVVILGLFLLVQYLAEIFTAYGSGKPPASLGVYTTLELAALELGIMIPLHIFGGILLWKQEAAGYLLAIILTFTAFMTFISLSISLLIFYFLFEMGSVFDVMVPIILAVVATAFSIVIFRRVKN